MLLKARRQSKSEKDLVGLLAIGQLQMLVRQETGK